VPMKRSSWFSLTILILYTRFQKKASPLTAFPLEPAFSENGSLPVY